MPQKVNYVVFMSYKMLFFVKCTFCWLQTVFFVRFCPVCFVDFRIAGKAGFRLYHEKFFLSLQNMYL